MVINEHDIGDDIELTATFKLKSTGAPANPGIVTFKVEDPHGAETTTSTPDAAITNPSVGEFRMTVSVALAGQWTYRTEGVGAGVVGAEEKTFFVLPSAFS